MGTWHFFVEDIMCSRTRAIACALVPVSTMLLLTGPGFVSTAAGCLAACRSIRWQHSQAPARLTDPAATSTDMLCLVKEQHALESAPIPCTDSSCRQALQLQHASTGACTSCCQLSWCLHRSMQSLCTRTSPACSTYACVRSCHHSQPKLGYTENCRQQLAHLQHFS